MNEKPVTQEFILRIIGAAVLVAIIWFVARNQMDKFQRSSDVMDKMEQLNARPIGG